MSRPPCRFFNKPDGCNRGDKCNFSHVKTTPGDPADAGAANDNLKPSGSQSKPPPGACHFFWSSGACRNEFKCRFKHVSPSDPPTPSFPRLFGLSTASNVAAEKLAPFLTPEGLVKLLGSGSTDSYFPNPMAPMSPNEAHNAIKRFLHDDFRFRRVTDIYAFIIPINSASSHNTLWSLEDGQLFFSALATGNGLLRIDDVLRWPNVSIAPSGTQALSFHRGYLPLLRFLASDFITKSTMHHLVNALYSRILENMANFSETIERCFAAALKTGSFNDPAHPQAKSPVGHQVIVTLVVILFECLTRFKNAALAYPKLATLTRSLREFSDTWVGRVTATPSTVQDSLCNIASGSRDHIIAHLKGKLDRLRSIVDREEGRIKDTRKAVSAPLAHSNDGLIAALHASYEGPGTLRPLGPRHDNDFVDINDIRIAPTDQELMSRIPPFLPANIHGAPHPHPESSMLRLLDTQFRLLREELTAPLRSAVQLVSDDLQKGSHATTPLAEILKKGGGKYRSTGPEGTMFNIYSNIRFYNLVPDRRGLSTAFSFATPPGRARSENASARAAFWEGMGGRRMMQGGLVALVWKRGPEICTHLGLLSSSAKDLSSSAKQSPDFVSARVVFFDPEVELRILDSLKSPTFNSEEVKLLVEAPVMYEAIRPFLEALRTVPESVPFAKYLPHHRPSYFQSLTIDPPRFSTAPGFRYQLASLFDTEADVDDLVMNVTQPASIDAARQVLRRSRLDPSQSDSVVDALTREVALIQGPPGTGKSYTGVELLRVLIDNGIGPILLIAFTNHALDHLLCSVLDAGFTRKIVRLGSRSADDRISQYSLETKEIAAGQSRLFRTFGDQHRSLRDVEDEIKQLMKKLVSTDIPSPQLDLFILLNHPGHYEFLHNPPPWIHLVKAAQESQTAGWQQVGKQGRHHDHDDKEDKSMYNFWSSNRDLNFLQFIPPPLPPSQKPAIPATLVSNAFAVLDTNHDHDDTPDSEAAPSDEGTTLIEEEWQYMVVEDNAPPTPPNNHRTSPAPDFAATPETQPPPANKFHVTDLQNPTMFFDARGLAQPSMPDTDRPLVALLEDNNIWSMSASERERLNTYWVEYARRTAHENYIQDFVSLREQHATLLAEYNEGQNEVRRQLLQNTDIIGCTTTGAAKLTSLLKGLDLRVMMVEEAGQVLEAHILGSLVPSIEHLILIGDPQQLRPTLNNYGLSMDSRRGSKLFRFDMSLMERLAFAGFPMSRIDVQRRMRPTISNLIRRTLYPSLEDHSLVMGHPHVRGLNKDVYFLTHSHQENSQGDESASKYNTYEVEMIRDLVLYLLRQGCYSQDGDIVVLCAYLGQLARVRDALAGEVTVTIDKHDQEKLDANEDDATDGNQLGCQPDVETIGVTKLVRLRTVDNYQGEEAKIVILSLVRNSGTTDEPNEEEDWVQSIRPSIGFLKSDNRTNVALSRAREGLYILGNAPLLSSKSPMWCSVLDELASEDAVGPGLPVACSHHPEYAESIQQPGQLSRVAPDGGCLQSCDYGLQCGHLCPYKCHPDDPKHLSVACTQLCRRLCSKGHPCEKQCTQDCGNCNFPVPNVQLPCLHICLSVPCYMLDRLSDVVCDEQVRKYLPECEHEATMACSMDPAQYKCRRICNGSMGCCGRPCKSLCYQCQAGTHREHPCDKLLHCAHRCVETCSTDHHHTSFCKESCRQECVHTRCAKACSTPCAPCQEPCSWRCAHHECPVPCGSVCTRLPCNLRCTALLACGHRCPSVCGEDCNIQMCNICADQDALQQVVDMILYRTFGEVDPDQETLDELTITLPKCRHTFTVETLDGHCGLSTYYTQDETGAWASLRSPQDLEPAPPPVCPTCRAAITSPRYGRVFKRADLDILERNVIAQMTRSLTQVQDSLGRIDKVEIQRSIKEAMEKGLSSNPKALTPDERKSQAAQRRQLLVGDQYTIMPPDALNPSTSHLHNISSEVSKLWMQQTALLNNIYRQLRGITDTRSSHIRAWEASFSFLYQKEMDTAVADPDHAPWRPREHALHMARMKVGQPQPRADKRFIVEGIWLSLRLRFILVEIGRGVYDSFGSSDSPKGRQSWAVFIIFVLRSCSHDAKTALEIAKESESHRQIVTTTLFIMRAEFDTFNFNVEMSKHMDQWNEKRDGLVEAAEQKANQVEHHVSLTLSGIPPQTSMDDLRAMFQSKATAIIEEWKALASSLRDGYIYLPISKAEQIEIVRAFNFSYAGHFYNCPNGHTFVITECGGAMERATCPECGAPIGGSHHTLDSSNTRSTEYESIARAQGAQSNPWAWG